MFLNKELCANVISLRVQTRIALLNEEHLINETVKFPWHFFRMRNWLSLMTEACIPMGCQKMFTDR